LQPSHPCILLVLRSQRRLRRIEQGKPCAIRELPGSLLQVAPDLENCTLQTRGKHYNVHLHPVPSPAREEDERHTASIDNFYFPQDFLVSRQKGQKWTWNAIRPEAILWYTSKPNGINSALTFALYFMICKELGSEAVMPPTNDIGPAQTMSATPA